MAVDPTAAATEGRQDTGEEVRRLREENLRYRDLLIAKDAELGALKGQVAALEAGSARVLSLFATIKGLMPGPLQRVVLAVLRRLR